MKNHSFILFSFILFLLPLNLLAQDLPEIVPLSPNAASIAKYGEIPVGHFTGVPNIGIPLYTITSGDLTLPLSLSYHAGGNKVESVASWVGLGWSLGSIPSISRSVRGLPDENGFYTKYNGQYSVADLAGETENPLPSQNIFDAYKNALFSGFKDSEPDIFTYSIPGESGKFFWDQETQVFITYPKSNIKILRDGLNFTLVSQDGVEYTFNRHDKTKSDSSVEGTFITNAWYATKMVSATKKDSIRFTYKQENQNTKTSSVSIKYHYLGGVTGNGNPTSEGSILNNNLTYAMLPDSIISSNGYIKFNKNINEREDLKNGKSLNNISIYNNQNKLITKFQFTQRFKTGTGSGGGTTCANIDDYSKKWMLLDKLEQVSNNNTNEKLTHSFLYNESYFPACRISAAQDYWGFYNGHDDNQNLIPPHIRYGTNILVSGADRSVNTTKSDYGILEKIIYPTGGYTEFDYENNEALNPDLEPQHIKVSEGLFGDDYYDTNGNFPPNLRNFESSQFTINNSNGGSQIEFTIQLSGCNISQGGNNCAVYTMTNIATNQKWFPHLDGTTSYAPNGTYKLNADFGTNNNNYQDFIFIVEWDELVPNQSNNRYVGGIRVKEVRNYTDTNTQPIVKKYKYTADFNSNDSSGDIFGTPNFSHSENIRFYKNNAQGGITHTSLQRVRSISNVQQVSHSGSFIGYKKVFEETNDINKTGYVEYEFSHQKDSEGGGFPYPPSQSAEIERGLLLKQNYYKKTSNGFIVSEEKSLEYTSNTFDSDMSTPKHSVGIKWENIDIGAACSACQTAQNLTTYYVIGGWKQLSKETTKSYFDTHTIINETNYFYDNEDHLLLTRSETKNSNDELLITQLKYPQDITNPTQDILDLINQNRIRATIETTSYLDKNNNGVANATEITNSVYNKYIDLGSALILPEKVQTSKGQGALEDRIVYHNYDSYGNPLEVSKADGTSIYYIWGYNKQYPIGKLENFTSTQAVTIQSLINIAIANSNLDNDRTLHYLGKEGDLREALDDIRNHVNVSNVMVTTYTYDPLIGVTSMTDPRGYTVYYEYDEFNRLKRIKDAQGKIISENTYHYKNQ